MITIRTPFHSPPLRSNDRRHWRAHHRVKSDAMEAMVLVARGLQRITAPVVATLVWEVTDRRRRDVGASGPTLKVCLDALVRAGVLVDDSSRQVVEERCRIEIGDKAGVRLEIEEANHG